ncbi:Arm DNA-binding domain-containing protein [Neptuniibacter pectenicola]|uniref:Arm DNA-binding domain-containing protein n=1 Tax=Neptuniibacter pectenicola TaxID=1806669 RepID=UPI0030EB3FA7
MNTKFKFTDARIRALPTNPSTAKSTELEFSDTEITGLKCLSSKKAGSKRFLLRYVFQSRKRSITLGRFPDINVATARKAAQSYRTMLVEGINQKAEQGKLSSYVKITSECAFWILKS